MKEFMRKCMITFGLIILGAFLYVGILTKDWNSFKFAIQVFFVTVIIHLVQLVTNKFTSNYHLLEILVEFIMVLMIVLLFGFVFKWYTLSSLWMICTTILLIYTACYILDVARTNKDVSFINEQIKIRKKKMEQEK